MKKNTTLSKLLIYIKPYMPMFIISLVMTAGSVLSSLLIPVMFGEGVDLIISEGNVDIEGVVRIACYIVIIIATGAVCQRFSGVLSNKLTFNMVKKLRAELFVKLEEIPLSYLDQKSSGDLLSRCITDVEQISDGLLMGFNQLFNGVLTIICAIVLMARISPLITIAIIALTPASFALTKLIASRTHRMFLKQAESRGEMTAFTDEAIENMKLIYAFDHKDLSRAEFDEKNARLSEYSLKATFFSSLVNPSTRLIYSTIYALVTIMGGIFVIGQSMTVGALSALLGYANQYSRPFNEITGTVTEFQNALASASRVFELLETVSAEAPFAEILQDSYTAEPACVSIEDVSFSYDPAVPLIKNFNLFVPSGKRVAIVGPTGCGKTTIINLLMRFYDVDSGCIKVNGEDVKKMSHSKLRGYYGMVLQDIWLKTGTIRENIAYGRPDASFEEIREAAKSAYADDFISRLPKGYDTLIGESEENLSEGQKQLICIARVMLTDPPMLILDEATSNVDSMTEIRITKAFERLMKGHTSFIVAHRLSTIVNSDLILVMNNGNIIEQGTHEELLAAKGFYYELHSKQGGVLRPFQEPA